MNKTIKIILGVSFVVLVLFILISARKYQQSVVMQDPEINLKMEDGLALITQSELLESLRNKNLIADSMKRSDFNMKAIENFLLKSNEIDSVEVYTKLDGRWFINAKIKKPIIRIISSNDSDFYIEDKGQLMRLSPFSRPKTLIATGMEQAFGSSFDYDAVINNDSLITKYKLSDLYRISSYVCNDAFYNALIVQIDYSPELGFSLVPRVGNQVIIFGNAPNDEVVKERFFKLTTFYNEVIPYEGWEKYRSIDLRFDDQIVAKKKNS